MQKMFTDTVTSALIEKDKTKWVIQEEWSKKKSKSFKSQNLKGTGKKDFGISKEQAKQTTDNQKHEKNVES